MAKLICQWVAFILAFTYVLASTSFEPLILTPLLNAGKIKEAQEAARVVPDMNGEKSYSGFFLVNEKCDNNLFFWFFPAQNNWEKAPVLLWLNGGPGSSSLIGMFEEVGPFNYVKKKKFVKNEYTWTKDNNVIFLDQPVGTGFSFTRKNCYCDNMTIMAEQVHSVLEQFYRMFPNLENNPFFITGESFAGHYIPAIASEIHKRNSDGSKKINLIGYAIGNAAVDTRCEKFANYMYENGIIDDRNKEKMNELENNIVKAIDAKNYTKAGEEDNKRFVILYNTKLPTVYNVQYDEPAVDFWQVLVKNYHVRKQIHVGNVTYRMSGEEPWDHMQDAMYMNTMSYVEELLDTQKYVIGFYSGLLDLRIPYTTTECYLRELKWRGSEEYLSANRSAWYVGDRLAGWYKVAGNLFEVTVRGAGHLVPTDQPEASLALISAVIRSRPGETPLSTLNPDQQK